MCLCSVSSYCEAKERKPKPKPPAATNSFSVTATPADRIKTLKDFKVELLYTVPKDEQGSWVNLCADPRGRLIVSDQIGQPVPRHASRASDPKTSRRSSEFPIELGQAHGLLWVGDVLYVVVNGDDKTYKNGLYRVSDTNGDDQLDKVELLHQLRARRRTRTTCRAARARSQVALRALRQ